MTTPRYTLDKSTGLLTGAPYIPAPDIGGPLAPEIVVVHYTASASAASAVAWLSHADKTYVSAHVVIDKDGTLTQLVPFTRVAWHAGESTWEGRPYCNRYAVGIELVNRGPVLPTFAGPAIRAAHKNDPTKTVRLWEAYPDAQIEALVDLCRTLRYTYGVREIVGHDDVAPRRKQDPGPAFPMELVQRRVFDHA